MRRVWTSADREILRERVASGVSFAEDFGTPTPALMVTPPILTRRGLSLFVRIGNLAVRCSFDSSIADHPSVVPQHVAGLVRAATRAMLEDHRLYTEVEDAQP